MHNVGDSVSFVYYDGHAAKNGETVTAIVTEIHNSRKSGKVSFYDVTSDKYGALSVPASKVNI